MIKLSYLLYFCLGLSNSYCYNLNGANKLSIINNKNPFGKKYYDEYLQKKYQNNSLDNKDELEIVVDKDKIMTSDDFWKSHENQLNGFMIDNDSNNITKKGKQTTIFSDFRPEIKRNNNGDYYMNIKITSNDKENIFLMYPSVKKAYDNEVPDRYTEEEFWILYFQSEFYNKDKAHDGLKLSSGTDDIFSRYESTKKHFYHNQIKVFPV
jgi:hypothetical protein